MINLGIPKNIESTSGAIGIRDQKTLAQLLGILGQSRIANNLNQLAKAVNMGSLPLTPDVEQDIKKACSNISEMRVMLINALGLRDGEQS